MSTPQKPTYLVSQHAQHPRVTGPAHLSGPTPAGEREDLSKSGSLQPGPWAACVDRLRRAKRGASAHHQKVQGASPQCAHQNIVGVAPSKTWGKSKECVRVNQLQLLSVNVSQAPTAHAPDVVFHSKGPANLYEQKRKKYGAVYRTTTYRIEATRLRCNYSSRKWVEVCTTVSERKTYWNPQNAKHGGGV